MGNRRAAHTRAQHSCANGCHLQGATPVSTVSFISDISNIGRLRRGSTDQTSPLPLIIDTAKPLIPLGKPRCTDRPCRGRRKRRTQPVAHRHAQRPARRTASPAVPSARREDRPPAPRAQGQRGARPRRQAGALARHAARPAQLGPRPDLRGDDRHAVQQ